MKKSSVLNALCGGMRRRRRSSSARFLELGVLPRRLLVAFIGDVNRFATPEKLVAYIGLDCRVYQSGTSVQGKGYISKRGKATSAICFSMPPSSHAGAIRA